MELFQYFDILIEVYANSNDTETEIQNDFYEIADMASKQLYSFY